MTQAILGIDISKKDLALALLSNDRYQKRKISNDIKGFKSLTDWLNSQDISCVKVCMEATGSYGEEIADYMYAQGYQVHVINPVCIKSFAKSKLNRHKTDEVDSMLIAEYASKNNLRLYQPPDPVFKELKSLYRCSQNLKLQKTQVNNLLENKKRLPKSVQKVYEKLNIHIESQIQAVSLTIEKLLLSQENIKKDYYNLQTITGVGPITAVAILAEIPAFSSLENARQIAAYAGLTPCHKTSGTSLKGKSCLSKWGLLL